jgi:hypothetical protein
VVSTGSCGGGCGGCGGCSNDCGCDNGHFLRKLCDRLGSGGGLFHRNNDCGCGCDSGCGHGHGHSRLGGHHGSSCSSCCTTTSWNSCGCGNGCGSGHGHGCGFRGLFHRNNGCDCCNSCNSCGNGYGGYGGAVIISGPGAKIGEPIAPPQGSPLPKGDNKGKGDKGKDDKGKTSYGDVEPPMTSGIPEAGANPNLDIVPPAVVPNIPVAPGKSPF